MWGNTPHLDRLSTEQHIARVKLSNRGRYAVRALFDMAFFDDGRPAQVKDIAERQSIPPRFLEQIFRDLRQAGFVDSKRGPQGGYRLAKSPETLRVGDVLRVIEGRIALADPEPAAPRATPAPSSIQATELVWKELSTRVEACFDGVTLADICTRAEQLGVRRANAQRYVYVI